MAETSEMKKCTLDCEFAQEGYCAIQYSLKGITPSDCKAKKQGDLVCSECGKKECECND